MSWRGAAVAVGGVGVAAVAAGLVMQATVGLPWDDASAGPSAPAAATPPPPPAWDPAPTVLDVAARAGTTGGEAVADAVAPQLAADALGGRVGASVIDLTSGAAVYSEGSDVAQTPASTLKILTAAAVLDVLGADHRFTTSVVAASPTSPQITLVGGGDPALTAGDDAGATRLDVLAEATANALTQAGVTSVELSFDDSLFTGPAADPDWESTYVGSVASPVSALAVDGGRTAPDSDRRSSDPAAAATAEFADELAGFGVEVVGEPTRAVAPADAVAVATTDSPPLSTIVEDVLAESDNDGAEMLARHVALGTGRPGTSADASAAMVDTLTALGVDLAGASILDGSGLARGNAVSAAALTSTLALAAGADHPDFRAVVTGLPVAGFTGTLDDRFDGNAAALGITRAKTGTLTGVSGLAGVTVGPDGAAYLFAVLADDVADTEAARAALDDVVTAIAAQPS